MGVALCGLWSGDTVTVTSEGRRGLLCDRARAYANLNPALITLHVVCEVASDNFSLNEHICVTVQGLVFVANLWFGGFPDPVNPGRPEWSKVQTRGKPLVATAQAKYVSAGE